MPPLLGGARPLPPGPRPLAPVWTVGGWSPEVKCDWLDAEDQTCNWLLQKGLATWLWGDDVRTWNAGVQRFLPPMLRIAPFEADYGGLVWLMLLVRFLATRNAGQPATDCLGTIDCYYGPDGSQGGQRSKEVQQGWHAAKMLLLFTVRRHYLHHSTTRPHSLSSLAPSPRRTPPAGAARPLC